MKFRNEFNFLSNFAPAEIKVRGMIFPTIAQAPTVAEAKRLGRRVTLRSDWESLKEEVMLALLKKKFKKPLYRNKLKAVKGKIVEENDWGDKYWGQCNGVGKNRLGVLLMQVRSEIE